MTSFVKRALRRSLWTAAHPGLGRRAIASVIVQDATLALRPMRMATATSSRFASVETWPDSIRGFEDLAFLFTSSPLNMGIVSMTFAEVAYLFRLVRSLRSATVAEIGRYQGGSTLVIAAALGSGGRLYSYDTHRRRTPDYTGADMDAALADVLKRYGLAEGVNLLVEDSTAAEPPGACDLVFVDGDHTYEGVRADYEHWRGYVRPGGHLLFHDAVLRGVLSSGEPDSARLVREIEHDDGGAFERREGADSLAHFVRTGARAPFDRV